MFRFANIFLFSVILTMGHVADARADMPKVLSATVEVQANGLYAFSVTVSHADEGWTHYLDSWEVMDNTGTVLAVRTVFHPHDKDIPFTQSLANVSAPIGAREVTIRAHCSVDGYGDSELVVALPPR